MPSREQSPDGTATPPTAALARIRASATDGRAHNAIYRRAQLKRLHDAVAAHAAELERAIVAAQSTRVTPHDARLELCFAVRAVRELAGSDRLDAARALEAEYAVSRGQDAGGARRPVGIVVLFVHPGAVHTLVYSVVAAVAAALAGGNAVVLQIKQTTRELPAMLSRVLTSALDDNTFTIATAAEIDAATRDREDVAHFIMDPGAEIAYQDSPPSKEPSPGRLLASAHHRTVVAVVERDADLDEAATALVNARWGLGGTSPYAPDMVLVNEWAQQGFLEAVARRTSAVIPARLANSSGLAMFESGDKAQQRSKGGVKDKVVTEGDLASISIVQKRHPQLLLSKMRRPHLQIHPVTSMDDAIDTINSNGHGRYLAAYVFSKSPANAKYLTQFIDADSFFVNQVPTRLLVGPAHPHGHLFDPAKASISPDLFTVPVPVYAQSIDSPQDPFKKAAKDASSDTMAVLAKELSKPLKALDRPLKQVNVGFFEQGIMTGAMLVVGTVCTSVGLLGFYGYRIIAARSRMG